MSDDLRRDAHATLTLCAAIAAAIAVAAVAVRLTLAAPAREVLGYPFADQHPSLAGAAAILATNARKLAGVYGLALVAQAPMLAGEGCRPRAGGGAAAAGVRRPRGRGCSPRPACWSALHSAPTARAWRARCCPTGPSSSPRSRSPSLCTCDARRRPVGAGRALGRAATGLALLAAAALLETYAGLPT